MSDTPQPTVTTQWSNFHSPISPSQPQNYLPQSASSPNARHPLTRPLSPDLPTKDALYLFSNFASYMRSPGEGAEGIRNSEDFRDTVRLLDHARYLASQPYSNVHVLHLKYRFIGPGNENANRYSTGDQGTRINDNGVPVRNPVPQPFSVLHDPVVKIDYRDQGVFEPLPAQAVFAHIARSCQPPPRIIVISYVCSKVTETHLASLSTWARTSSPPAYIFSPLETRLRESRPLHLALHHAIPMSMYAWPAESSPSFTPSSYPNIYTESSISSSEQPFPSSNGSRFLKQQPENEPIREIQRSNSPNGENQQNLSNSQERQYPPDPVARLTVITASAPILHSTPSEIPDPSPSRGNSAPSHHSHAHSNPDPDLIPKQLQKSHGQIGTLQPDRIPLWMLVPGFGALNGSTAMSIGIHLHEFSAINLKMTPQAQSRSFSSKDGKLKEEESFINKGMEGTGKKKVASVQMIKQHFKDRAGSTSIIRPIEGGISGRDGIHGKGVEVNGVNGGGGSESGIGGGSGMGNEGTGPMIMITPPDRKPPMSLESLGRSGSWPAGVNRVTGWRKGRKEMMEDTLEELNLGLGSLDQDLTEKVGRLLIGDYHKRKQQEGEKEKEMRIGAEQDIYVCMIRW
ncbi:hypothetical protein TREMEDRAFT_30856 [Tremella mesenterica DSM 1558]|uniref:uncharacterized protein n=1 Tax=Tremella mesenterica (strain ATCC 24925 / CBS 8224 / DSM 1558 / NBRC 9311 / NRRL Y-6157 / RJB 2259-6 / UBC 559-6) TaxID=578456 RepID=UPI0003F493C7|nr:uncharacterized protein TREMEDRAFT_30856 [Tremella mesenterica DSM 1558]EIW69576.1 hypothetical protein TREMEDRAFT_30856 [Tremella mesenterica DSM 1558]